MMAIKLEGKFAAEDALAEVAGRACLGQRLLETLVLDPYLAMDIVVSGADSHGISRDDHPLDEDVRVVADDVAILEGARLALVRVAHQVLGAGELPRHETPLQPGREARAAAAAQGGFLHLGDDRVRRDFFRDDLAQRLITAARLIVLEAPVRAVEARHDYCVGAVFKHFSSAPQEARRFFRAT